MTRQTIGRAARAAGVNVETIRFYERRGLVRQPPRPAHGGTREYDSDTVARVRFVRQAQEIGFTLREVTELLSVRADPAADCGDVRVRAIGKRDEVEAKVVQLLRIRDALNRLIASCPGGGGLGACTILEAMEHGSTTDDAGPAHPATARGRTNAMKTTELVLEGMHCDGCARTIEAVVGRIAGVRKVEVAFEECRARILHDPAGAPVADLIDAIRKAGFQAAVAGP